jgi:hypothetical protein
MFGTCNGADCNNGNGSYTLLHPSGCSWSGNNTNSWTGTIECQSGRWVLTIKNPSSDECAIFSVPNTTGCPPENGWVLDSSNCGFLIIISVFPGPETYDPDKFYCATEVINCPAGCATGTSHNECINGGWLNGVGIENCFNNGPGYGNMKVITVGSAHDSPDCDCESPCTCPTPTPVPTPTPTMQPTPTAEPIDCPANCDACDVKGDISALVSELAGSCFNPVCSDCNTMNTTHNMTRDGCSWSGPQVGGCVGPILHCVDQAWIFYFTTNNSCAIWTAPNTDGCPPVAGWTWVSGNCSQGKLSLSYV